MFQTKVAGKKLVYYTLVYSTLKPGAKDTSL